MASIEYIAKRIEGKEKEINKLEKKLERILKAQATNWEVNPYYYNENDIKWTKKDLEDANKSLNKYKADLETAQQKANSRNVKVIVDFLEDWKAKTKKYYTVMVGAYRTAYAEWREYDRKHSEWLNTVGRTATREEYREKWDERREVKKAFTNEWGWLVMYLDRDGLNEEKLDKDLKEEVNRKYDFIIERTNAIVGTITDASNLHIGMDGELNGYIIGENGKAKVQTIGAGGWNIQRYHFRTLIHAMR